MFPSVGAMRETGTTVVIEDVAFPVERLAAITSLIAEGAMGEVWFGRQNSLNRPVAVKLIRAGALATPLSPCRAGSWLALACDLTYSEAACRPF